MKETASGCFFRTQCTYLRNILLAEMINLGDNL